MFEETVCMVCVSFICLFILNLLNIYLLCAQHTLSTGAKAGVTAGNKGHWHKGSFPEMVTILLFWN